MRTMLVAVLSVCCFSICFSQGSGFKSKKYPSLLWEIKGKGLVKPSYLFGTMHVSSKMVFHLSDSFYLALKNADVVALETNPGNWQEDFSRYDMEGSYYNVRGKEDNELHDYLSINTLKAFPYEKLIETALYNNPSIINSFLYRSNSETSSDFEEDTYLDLYIYQVGKKWNKKVCGVENFDESMTLMKEAYADAAKDKNIHERSYDNDNEFSYGKLEEAYRTGNLDLLDTINKINSTSAAFDEKFLYKRNEIQAASIDSILKTKASLFVGVGAAHLPGERGVIELLRKNGYVLRPIKMTERDSRHKESIETIRVPVQFKKQTAADGFFSVNLPGKLYSFGRSSTLMNQQQYADMSNGSYYMVSRIYTNAALWGQSTETVLHKIDSVLYENIPGKIISKKPITKNGFNGFDILNKTRRGDYQRYNIFVTPYEVILFKMSGNGEYVKSGKEADGFFNSIQLKEYQNQWIKYSPAFGGFKVEMPGQPFIKDNGNLQFSYYDKPAATNFEIVRTDIHNTKFVEEDSFDLDLLEESFGSSEFIEKQLSRKHLYQNGYAALACKYKYKDCAVALVNFIIQGPHYYTLITNAKTENAAMHRFLNSFTIMPFAYTEAKKQKDTSLRYTVSSPVAIQKEKKLTLYPQNMFSNGADNDEELIEVNDIYKDGIIADDSTGEKIYVSAYKPSRYFENNDTVTLKDTTHFITEDQNWTYINRKKYELPGKTQVVEYEVGDPQSSRVLRGKSIIKNGIRYDLLTQGDTLTQWNSFINNFFATFTPFDSTKELDVKTKKSKIFFTDFFSNDTLLHKKAIKNIQVVKIDSTGFYQLQKAIESLGWKEKKYMEAKNTFIFKLSAIPTQSSADYLKQIYYAAGDTVELQYTALEALLKQKTAYAFRVFKDIIVNEPPVLDVSSNTSHSFLKLYTNNTVTDDDDDTYSNGSFFDELKDSLALTKNIFKDILPLVTINDYEQPVMDLLETMVDSNMVEAKDYEIYLPKFLIEVRQQMKKQVITEKNKAIEKAGADKDDDNHNSSKKDYGNRKLISYATILMPFYNSNAAIVQLFDQMLRSHDKRLQYNTVMLMLRHKKTVPDSLINFFAGQDEFRFELYDDLKSIGALSMFPAAFNNPIDLARSKLLGLNSYATPDSILYLDKLPLQYKERKGFVYFFKYREKKDDKTWRIAMTGLVPASSFDSDMNADKKEKNEYDFTEMTATKIVEDEPLKIQLQKALKKKLYSKRKSGILFYDDENRYGQLNSIFNFRE